MRRALRHPRARVARVRLLVVRRHGGLHPRPAPRVEGRRLPRRHEPRRHQRADFVNLMHPGVQSTLGDYCAELASGYPGLWGIQTDYHRFPLDNNTGDGNPGPYSYDSWSRQIFQIVTGFDPINFGANPSGPAVGSVHGLSSRPGSPSARASCTTAIDLEDPGLQFSGAVFAQAITNPSQFVKMQDWPTMAANGWLPLRRPHGLRDFDLVDPQRSFERDQSRERGRVVPGLAILTNTNRPTITAAAHTAAESGPA
jgi:signal recognition particle subunit SEC65